ncbi:MAG: rhomboid family intramembrane serine protease [Rhodanobacteraceae bacterium]|nr:rhomboid family intramembrane serine protease [Rhodanobacteraceae bacterium]
MLIVPLHRPFNRANFPFATIALVLANVFVFLFLQSSDGAAEQRAVAYYSESRLGDIELPLYREWMQKYPDSRRQKFLDALDEHDTKAMAARVIQSDTAFVRALQADQLMTPQDSRHAQWKRQREAFDLLWQEQFTQRHLLRNSEVSPSRMFSSMFLHGSFGHLLGNMIFLVVLGLLVEGALGSLLFIGVYLLAGCGAALVALGYHWGDAGGMLGASGAIAGLMGAYCVLWGMRKVRVFWWAFVVFDYSRVTALWLLPFWLGWELFNLAANADAGVGFDAHAGGIVSGALLALGVRTLGWERRDFLDEDEKAERARENDDALSRALQHLGKLETRQARALLEPLDAAGPPSLDVRIALYRCARYGNELAALRGAVQRLLELPVADAASAHKVKQVLDDFRKIDRSGPVLAPAQQLQLARAWLRIGADADADTLVRDLVLRAGDTPGVAEICWQLAQRAREGSPEWRARLELIAQHCPRSEFAPKAAFLLAQVS